MNQLPRWTEVDIPDLRGKTAVVTGASAGLGLETARLLAGHGATVVMACRNEAKADAAASRIRDRVPGARLSTVPLDLASLASIREAAARIGSGHQRLDLLINNAGGIRPHCARTEDGFEETFGVNHLGPFAFTAQVLDPLLAVPGPGGWNEFTGWPQRVESVPAAHDAGAQRRLWEESERLTGIAYRIGTVQPHPGG